MFKKLALAAIIAAGSTAAAQAATVYASSVISTKTTQTVSSERADAASALGAADKSFYSLGLGGEIVLGFDKLVSGLGSITEVTFALPNYFEYANVFTSLDGETWTSIGQASNQFAQAGLALDGGSDPFQFVKLVDVSPGKIGSGRDGFDIDAIGFEEYVPAPVPLPAAGFLLIGALVGMGGLSLRRKKA
jgi:hypothetical protein